jgi:hypothetical protein
MGLSDALSAHTTLGWRCFAASRFGDGSTGGAKEVRVATVEDGSDEEFLSVLQRGIQF